MRQGRHRLAPVGREGEDDVGPAHQADAPALHDRNARDAAGVRRVGDIAEQCARRDGQDIARHDLVDPLAARLHVIACRAGCALEQTQPPASVPTALHAGGGVWQRRLPAWRRRISLQEQARLGREPPERFPVGLAFTSPFAPSARALHEGADG